ncbi:hypothetical protein RI054_26g108430 [Pseudoscourfieldia marina]
MPRCQSRTTHAASCAAGNASQLPTPCSCCHAAGNASQPPTMHAPSSTAGNVGQPPTAKRARKLKLCPSCRTMASSNRQLTCSNCSKGFDEERRALETYTSVPARAPVGSSRGGAFSRRGNAPAANLSGVAQEHAGYDDDDDAHGFVPPASPGIDAYGGVAETGATYSQNVTYKGLSARHLASNATRTAFIYAVPELGGETERGCHEHVLLIKLPGGDVHLACTCTGHEEVVCGVYWGDVDKFNEVEVRDSCAKCKHTEVVMNAAFKHDDSVCSYQHGKLDLSASNWQGEDDVTLPVQVGRTDDVWLIHQPESNVHVPASLSVAKSSDGHVWPRACVTSGSVPNRSREDEVWICCSCSTKYKCSHVALAANAVDDVFACIDESTMLEDNFASCFLFSDVCTKETLDTLPASTSDVCSVSPGVSRQDVPTSYLWPHSLARSENLIRGGGIIHPCSSCAAIGQKCAHLTDAKPEDAPSCCNGWKLRIAESDAVLLHETCVASVVVHEWACECGKHVVPFDGKSSGIFNWSNKTLATHELCLDF